MTELVPADASPEKRLFISLLTRDIPMVAAFLDLIDNSVNAALERYASRLTTAEDYVAILSDEQIQPEVEIRLTISPERIKVVDSAPGIALATAQRHVFKFGRSDGEENDNDRLSVYGLGLKRAIFKLGNCVRIVSDHRTGGFSLDLDVKNWARVDQSRWEFGLEPRPPAADEQCGTKIEVWELHPETVRRIGDGVFENQLRESASKTYAYFLTKFVRIWINNEEVRPENLRVGSNHASDGFDFEGVSCTVVAGLGTPEGGRYRDSGSGWFVFCNGRTVISADKGARTGWGGSGLPIFQPKHRPFLGTVYFVSERADRLPWDTTKSGINEDSEVWQVAKRRMVQIGRGVTSFLDSRYTDEGTEVAQTELTRVTQDRMDAMQASVAARRTFEAPPPRRQERTTMRVQYDARIGEVRSIAEYLGKPSMSGSDVGRHTFQFFLRNEVGEE